MLYNVVNMSDHYTINCPDLEVAFVACVILGEGQYAFDPLDEPPTPENRIPLFLFGGSDLWCAEHLGGRTVDAVFQHVMTDRRLEIAAALDSIIVGDRAKYLEAVKGLTGDALLLARGKWHNKHRSSMNDIGGRAYRTAARLVAPTTGPATEPAPKQVFTA